MNQRIVRRRVRKVSLPAMTVVTLLGLALSTGVGFAEKDKPTTHTIFMSAVEIKGATTAKKLMPPAANPKELSKGYGFKAPGEADNQDPHKWEVSSYMFNPSFVTVRQGDTVKLTAFIVNGDEHEVWVTAPGGEKVVPNVKWNRGREYQMEFVAKQSGVYQLVCSEHAPSMITTFVVLPR